VKRFLCLLTLSSESCLPILNSIIKRKIIGANITIYVFVEIHVSLAGAVEQLGFRKCRPGFCCLLQVEPDAEPPQEPNIRQSLVAVLIIGCTTASVMTITAVVVAIVIIAACVEASLLCSMTESWHAEVNVTIINHVIVIQ
jgi:hypothetical protein